MVRADLWDFAKNLLVCFSLYVWWSTVIRGETHDKQQVGLFVARPSKDLVHEPHGARRMGKGCKPGQVQGRNQQAAGDAYRLHRVVTLVALAVFISGRLLYKYADQHRSGFKKRFTRIRTKGC